MAKGKGMKGCLLDYRTSGSMTKDYANSVSYVSLALLEEGPAEAPDPAGEAAASPDAFRLSEEEKRTLLGLARATVQAQLENGAAAADLSRFSLTPLLRSEMGAFVTLKKDGELRGCIGYLQGIKPLYKAVMDNALSAAFRDPRFPPVRREEEPGLRIEISVLSPIVAVKVLEEIEVGRDGLLITKGRCRGTLLPQVAVEYGWSREEFLEHACLKAGLPKTAYKEPGVVIERYSAQVFGEDEE